MFILKTSLLSLLLALATLSVDVVPAAAACTSTDCGNDIEFEQPVLRGRRRAEGKKGGGKSGKGGKKSSKKEELDEEECRMLIPHCNKCKVKDSEIYCDKCDDDRKEGGLKYEEVNGQCGFVIDFKDLKKLPPNTVGKVPTDYFGMENNFRYVNKDHYIEEEWFEKTGLAKHKGSSPNVVFGHERKNAKIPRTFASLWSSESLFTLAQIKVAPAFHNDLQVIFRALDVNGTITYEQTEMLESPDRTQTIKFGKEFEGIARVVFTGIGGTKFDRSLLPLPNLVAMDDIVVIPDQ